MAKEKRVKEKKSPLKAIKEYCKEQCCAGDKTSWVDCEVDCPLKTFRFGKIDKGKTSKIKEEKIKCNIISEKKDSVRNDRFTRMKFEKNDVLEGEMTPEFMSSLGIVQDTSEKEEKEDE
jgi:hypothetical protein